MRSGLTAIGNATDDALKAPGSTTRPWSYSVHGQNGSIPAVSTGFHLNVSISVVSPSAGPSYRWFGFPLRCLSTASEGKVRSGFFNVGVYRAGGLNLYSQSRQASAFSTTIIATSYYLVTDRTYSYPAGDPDYRRLAFPLRCLSTALEGKVRSGNVYIYYGHTLWNSGLAGYSWSHQIASLDLSLSGTAYRFGSDATSVYPSNGPGNRFGGYPLRCLSTASEAKAQKYRAYHLVRSGLINLANTAGVYRLGSIREYVWSHQATAFTSSISATAHELMLDKTLPHPSYGPNDRRFGFSLRCLSTALEAKEASCAAETFKCLTVLIPC